MPKDRDPDAFDDDDPYYSEYEPQRRPKSISVIMPLRICLGNKKHTLARPRTPGANAGRVWVRRVVIVLCTRACARQRQRRPGWSAYHNSVNPIQAPILSPLD